MKGRGIRGLVKESAQEEERHRQKVTSRYTRGAERLTFNHTRNHQILAGTDKRRGRRGHRPESGSHTDVHSQVDADRPMNASQEIRELERGEGAGGSSRGREMETQEHKQD